MIDLDAEKANIEREIQILSQQVIQLENTKNQTIIEIAKRQGMLDLLNRINNSSNSIDKEKDVVLDNILKK